MDAIVINYTLNRKQKTSTYFSSVTAGNLKNIKNLMLYFVSVEREKRDIFFVPINSTTSMQSECTITFQSQYFGTVKRLKEYPGTFKPTRCSIFAYFLNELGNSQALAKNTFKCNE